MNRLSTLFFTLLIGCILLPFGQAMAQSPEKMSYQAVIRNASGELVQSSEVGMRIQLLQGSEFGASVYVETHEASTNANGLLSIEIGTGTVVSGDFPAIDWSDGPYFLKTETDPAGGSDYSITGTSQVLSVPYALHAKTAENYSETDPVFDNSVAAGITDTDTTNWNNKLEAEEDGSVTNEIQTISRSGTTVTLSNGGGSFEDSVNVYTAGAGIEIADKVISRTAPTPSAFNVIGLTFQDLPDGELTTIDFTYADGASGTFIENGIFSLDTDEYTVPEDGVYFFEALLIIDTRSYPPVNLMMYYAVNGSTEASQRYYTFMEGGRTVLRLNMTLKLTAGDKISLQAQSYGNPTNTMGGNAYGNVRWSGFKVN